MAGRSCQYPLQLLLCILLLPVTSTLIHCPKGDCSKKFLPAEEGETPSCALPGETYCETVEDYPTDVILYLIRAGGLKQEDIYSNETMDGLLTETSTTINPSIDGVPPPPAGAGAAGASASTSRFSPNRQPHNINFGGFLPNNRNHSITGGLRFGPFFRGPYIFSSTLLPGRFIPHETWWTRFVPPPSLNSYRGKRQVTNSNQLCPTQGAFVLPKTALNKKGNWMFTVNLNDVDTRYTQLVRAEKCVSQRCNNLCAFPPGFFANCQQQFVQKKMVALNGGGSKLYTDMFWFPHCCVCQVKRI